MEPIDPQPNGPQLLYGLRYYIHINTAEEATTFHDQVGYWLWEPATGLIMQTIAIPRGQVVLAGGTAKPDDERIGGGAARRRRFGICSTTLEGVRTDYYRIDITFNGDGSWTYVTRTDLAVRGSTPPFNHRDTNTLRRVAPPAPNPLVDLLNTAKRSRISVVAFTAALTIQEKNMNELESMASRGRRSAQGARRNGDGGRVCLRRPDQRRAARRARRVGLLPRRPRALHLRVAAQVPVAGRQGSVRRHHAEQRGVRRRRLRAQCAPLSTPPGGSARSAPPALPAAGFQDRHGPGHACIAVDGPSARAITIETRQSDRVTNMQVFARAAALDLLAALLKETRRA